MSNILTAEDIAAFEAEQNAPPESSQGTLSEKDIQEYIAQQEAQQPGFLERIKQAFTGAPTSMDAGELPSGVVGPDGKTIPIRDLVAGARGNPLNALNIAQQKMPGVKGGFDPESGAPYVDFPREMGYQEGYQQNVPEGPPEPMSGKRFVNAPGFSMQDVANTIATAGPAALAAAPVARIGSGLLRGGALFGTEYAADLGMQVVGKKLGSGQEISSREAAYAGALGVAGEAVFGAVSMLRSLLPSNRWALSDGTVTEQGRKLFKSADIDPDEISPEMVKYFRELSRTQDPSSAAARTESASLKSPVNLTPGEAGGDASKLANESRIMSGAEGPEARAIMEGAKSENRQALEDNFLEIHKDITGQYPLEEFGGVNAAVERLENMAKGAKEGPGGIDDAYTAARLSRASIPRIAVNNFRNQAREALRKGGAGFSPMDVRAPGLEPVRFSLQQLDELVTNKNTVAVKIRYLEDVWRKNVQQVINDNTSKGRLNAVGQAMLTLKKQYDSWVEGALDDAVSSLGRGSAGAKENLAQWKKARALHSRYEKMFTEDAITKKLITGDYKNRAALDLVFGTAGAGFGKEAIGSLKRIQTAIGKDSDEWKLLKGEALLRLMRTNVNGEDLGTTAVQKRLSGSVFHQSFDRTMRDSPEVMRFMFSGKELSELKKLRNVSSRMSKKPGSITKEEKGQMLRTTSKLWNSLVGRGNVSLYSKSMLIRFLGTNGIYGEKLAKKALEHDLEDVPLIPRGVGATTAVTLGHETKKSQSSWEKRKKELGL